MDRRLKYFLIFSLASLTLFFLDRLGYLKIFHLTGDSLVIPIKKTTYQTYQDLVLKEKDKGESIKKDKEIIALKEEIKILKEENRSLRKQLETPLPPQWEYKDAKVIGLSHDLTIDKGKQSGLKKDQTVLLGNLLIGRIKQVSEKQSLVQLPVDPKSKIPVYTSETKAQGILTGQHGTRVILTNVLQDNRLILGDKILTSGKAGFPRGLLIGTIIKINKKSAEIYQQAEIELLLNNQELETVFVLVKE